MPASPSTAAMLLPKLNWKNRLVTMVLDQFIMSIIPFAIWVPFMVIVIAHDSAARFKGHSTLLSYLPYFALVFSLYLNKDIYLGQSPAKWVLKFQVVDDRTGAPANPIRCLARNLLFLIWPVELVAAMINPEKRLGDFLAGTRLAVYDQEIKNKANWALVGISFFLGVLICYLIFTMPMEWLLENLERTRGSRVG